MRNRANIIAWTLFGTGLNAASLLSCTSDEREFGPGAEQDAGERTTEGDNRDSGADADITNSHSPDASQSSTDENTGAISLTIDTASNTTSEPNSSSIDAGPTETSAATNSDAGADGAVSCSPVAETEANCLGEGDEDCDGLVDCEDIDDCALVPECHVVCEPVAETETTCNDNTDEDCDGFKDCADVDCAGANNCQGSCEPTVEDCTDAEDNDCDGYTDCADNNCAATAGCCSSDGVEVCNDGIDNDCDGVIDCPVIVTTVPSTPAAARVDWEGGAVAADQATLSLETPAATEYTVQCRSGKPAQVGSKQFVVCNPANPSGLDVKPFPLSEAWNPAHDGLISTQVRFAYPNGQVSQPVSYTYYVHSSLAGVATCPEKRTDDEYFAAAANYLRVNADPTFLDQQAQLAAPFVNIAFSPRASNVFEVAEGAGSVEYLSLRRRFVLNADKNLILMKRVYESRRVESEAHKCLAATIRKHASDHPDGVRVNGRYFRTGCDAVVMNQEGAGVCLVANESNEINVANPNSGHWEMYNFDSYGWVNWGQADNFMWRKLLPDGTGSVQVFSRKCYAGGDTCTGGNPDVLFLPDRDLFNW